MRWAIVLFAVAGCNQIFGLKPTKEFDAAVDVIPEAPLPRVQLTLQVASVDASGQPGTVGFAPITPAPKVRIASATGAFMDATYGADGSIEIPQSFPGTQWRLEYTLGADPPVEVQWSPGDGLGHLIVPLAGRADRDPPPMTGSYDITPTGLGVPYTFPHVLTTGLWTDTSVVSVAGQKVSANYANAVSLSGPRGNPLATRGDRGLLVDYTVGGNCRQAVGSADFAPDLSASPSVVTPPWAVTKRTPVGSVGFKLGRLTNALGGLDGGLGYTGTIIYGYEPSLQLPGFSQTVAGSPLPGPVLLTLMQCDYLVDPLPAVNAPAYLEVKGFPRIMHSQVANRRVVGGVALNSGMEVDATTASDAFDLSFPAAIPSSFKLATPDAQMKDLSGTSDNVPVTAMPGAYTLSFTPETGFQVDYTEVRLHEIGGGALTPLRTFTFTGTTVQIDGSNFTAGKHYVFEVRAHRGAPMAAQGDFTQLQYPLGLAIVFTRTIQT